MTMIYVAAALALVAGAFLLWESLSMPRSRRIARQLAAISRDAAPVEPEPYVNPRSARFPVPLAAVRRRFLLAELSFSRRLLLLIGVSVTIVLGLIGYLLDYRVALAALGVAVMLAAVYVNTRAVRNRRRFLELLPTFIDRLHQFLGAGNSLVTAFDKALEYSEPLVRVYLRPVAVRLAHGATLADSLQLQGYRLGVPELTMLSVIAHASQRFGGSLGEILTHVVRSLNDRLQVQREFDAMTAEIRASAKILVALPILVTIVVFLLNPGYLAFFMDDPLGVRMLGIALALTATGIIVVRLLSRIEG